MFLYYIYYLFFIIYNKFNENRNWFLFIFYLIDSKITIYIF